MPSARRNLSILAVAIAVTLAAASCGKNDGQGPEGAAGSGGAGGTGGDDTSTGGSGGTGGTMASDSAKPACEGNPGDSPVPDARSDMAGVLSADGKEMVVFGGDLQAAICGSVVGHTIVGDTWVLDTACGTWTSFPADPKGKTAPPARLRHAMALDARRNRALLFGGRTQASSMSPYSLFNDTWAFDFATHAWSKLATTGLPPSARSNMAMAVVGDVLILHGGNVSTSGLSFTPLGDVWSLDLNTNAWTQLSKTGGPKARLFHAMAADEVAGKVYVFSGGDANAFTGPFLRDVWAFNLAGKTWAKIDASAPSEGRIKFGMSMLPADGNRPPQLLVFAGHDDGSLGNRNDVSALNLADPFSGFNPVIPGDQFNKPATGACDFPVDFTKADLKSPERRSAFAFAALPSGKAFVIFGGTSDCGILNDAYWYDAISGTWTPIRTTLLGLSCLRTGSTTCKGLC